MSIFDRIKNAIFSNAKSSSSAGQRPGGTQTSAAPSRPAPGTTVGAQPARPNPSVAATPAAAQVVDIEEVLEERSKSSGQKLNWRTSIVDLMKLVGLDPTLENRKELARELGYQGSTADSASMNIWLHKQVMRKLAENGGKVPAALQD